MRPASRPRWRRAWASRSTRPATRIIDGAGGFSTGRFTEPEEVADLVLLLASDRAGNVTGADVLIDGGFTKQL